MPQEYKGELVTSHRRLLSQVYLKLDSDRTGRFEVRYRSTGYDADCYSLVSM